MSPPAPPLPPLLPPQIDRSLRAFINLSPAPSFIADENGIIRFLGDTYYRTFKTNGPSALGQSPYSYAPKEIADLWVDNIRRVATTGKTLETMEPALRTDGTLGHFLVCKFPLPSEPGQPRLVGGVCVDITERLNAESKLLSSEQRFAYVARTLNDGIWEWDKASDRLWWSPRNFELLGYSPDEIPISIPWFNDHLHPDDRDRVRHTYEQHLAGHTAEFRCEFRLRHKSGDYRWLSSHGKAVRDGEGRILHVIGAQYDITEHKRATIALAESREQLALAVDGAGLGTFYCTFPLDKIVWNDTCKDHFFLPRDADVDFDLFYARLHPDDRGPTRLAIERAQNLRETYNVQYRVLAPDGRQRWINAVGRFYYRSDGSPRRFDGITIDITHHKTSELARQQSEERYRFLADNIPQIAWTANPDGAVDSFNSRWFEYTGLDPTAPLPPRGQLREIVHPDDRPHSLQQWSRSLATGQPSVVEYRLRRHDGAYRWFLAQAAPMKNPDGSIARWFGTCTDIDDLKRAQADNALLLRETQAASDAKDRFFAVLSHELRTPLTPVLMTLGALESDASLPSHVHRDLALIRRNIDLETQLIDDLLDITRIAHGKIHLALRPTRLNTLLEHVCATTAKEARARGLHVSCAFDAQPDFLKADPPRLEQVFLNLFKNALKFTPDAGTIHLASQRTPEGLLITLRDSGVGIEPAALHRIFDAFEQGEQTVTRTYGGLGLGLTIARAIVDLHHGRIWAESPGRHQGTTFFVLLPAHDPAADDAPVPPAATPAAAPRQGETPVRILLVDDHDDTLTVTRRVLASLGYHVSTATTVTTALEALEQQPFDLLISDIGLPDGTGHSLLQQARAQYPALPAIALSGFGMHSDIQKSLAVGFNAHLTKPIAPDRLTTLITALT